MYFNFTFILILQVFQLACGQTQPASTVSNLQQENQTNFDKRTENLKRQADVFFQASINGDLEKTSKFIYFPTVVANQSTPAEIKEYRERNAKKIVQDAAELKTQGFSFQGVIGQPQELINADNQLFSLVPISTVVKAKGNRCDGKDFLLGISQDNGENWEFFKGNVSFQKQFELFFPQAAKKIKLPEKQKPDCYQE